MKALSIKQPWAWLICAGYKDIENRDWPTKYRGPVYIHAGLRHDYAAYEGDPTYRTLNLHIRTLLGSDENIRRWNGTYTWTASSPPIGAIIGEAIIIGCVTESKSPWFTGEYGFMLEKPKLYDKPIPYKGRLGFFEVSL